MGQSMLKCAVHRSHHCLQSQYLKTSKLHVAFRLASWSGFPSCIQVLHHQLTCKA
ncbi:unnamed protein product, partial [Staurois parvus]